MKESVYLPGHSPRMCINEARIRHRSYIISMSIDNNSDRPRINIQVEEKETTEQWISSFDINGKCIAVFEFDMLIFLSLQTAIETMTAKTGNYKPFHVFIEMLENSINKVNCVDFL